MSTRRGSQSKSQAKAAQGGIAMDIRYSLTSVFLHAAAMFVKRARDLESTMSLPIDDTMLTEHRGCVLAAIMQSTAALEAEIYEVVVHGPGHHLGSNGIDAAARDFLEPLADLIDDQRPLRRYEFVLALLKKQPIPRHGALWERALLLVEFRNALVHYKSRWGRETENKPLVKGLIKLKLSIPSFMTPFERGFPQRYLGADYGEWAVRTATKFLLEFYLRLGITAPVIHVEPKIDALLKKPKKKP